VAGAGSRLPRAPWGRILISALLVCIAVVLCMEAALATRGFHPTLADSERLWLRQRARAASLGDRALILVGASRMQSDLDLQTLHHLTGLEPVQLAIPADPGTPVLSGLAADPAVHGVILMDFLESSEASDRQHWRSAQYEHDYETRTLDKYDWDFSASEAYLTDMLHAQLRSYADGTRPITALTKRLLRSEAAPSYVTLLPDRERWLDFSRTQASQLYYKNVDRLLRRHPDPEATLPMSVFESRVAGDITRVTPEDSQTFQRNTRGLESMSETIESRGGRVIFVVMPVSGDVRHIFDLSYPRTGFWDSFAKTARVESFNFEDDAFMRSLTCPDGSHLDRSDRVRFTAALTRDLHLSLSMQYQAVPTSTTGE
jgi:hypothetical protein